MKLYKIKNWNEIYENNRSRIIKDLHWLPIPNRHDGETFSGIMLHKDGAMIFTAFILMLQLASKCRPRGSLIKDNGTPHNATSMSVKCRAPALWFEISTSYLESNTDWLDVEEVTSMRHDGDVNVPDERQQGDIQGRQRKKEGMKEGMKEAEAPSFVINGNKALSGYQKHPRTVLPKEWEFQQLWKKEWELFHSGQKCMWTFKDDEAVPVLLEIESDFLKIMEIAKKAWGLDGKNDFEGKAAIRFSSFVSQFNSIRKAVGSLQSKKPYKPETTAHIREIEKKEYLERVKKEKQERGEAV